MPISTLEITQRTDLANGEQFGEVGAYELLEGTAHFAVDPFNERNQAITDLDPNTNARDVVIGDLTGDGLDDVIIFAMRFTSSGAESSIRVYIQRP